MSATVKVPNPGAARLPTAPSVRRKMPAPFRRPSISVGTPAQAKRTWREVGVCQLAVGDILPGVGLIDSVTEHTSPAGQGWTLTVTGGEGNRRVFAGNDRVYAFVPDTP